ESMGLRRLQLSKRDLKRIFNRFRPGKKSARGNRVIPDNCEVITPLVLPIHEGLAREINRRSIMKQLRQWIAYDGPRLLWTYTPVTYGLESTTPSRIYHCVDLLGEFPGISRELIHTSERRLAASGARAIGSSEVVVDHLQEMGFKDVLPWNNVADVSLILSRRPDIERRSKRVVFAGNLSAAKIDFDLLEKLLQ
ncbi:hypothetical protein, partial [Escherichia coli]|uniref:hypothetical protein n=1 Tax=Escherichia coli TaxID=562 RepID=UPI0032E3B65E